MTNFRPEFPAFAFVDIETTGGNLERDRITEVGIVSMQDGVESRWEHLINPETLIPYNIQVLTGISPAMVQEQPTFRELAQLILDQLQDKIFVAHNARFDYGFLRVAFKRIGIDFRPKILCTVKLSRFLFPEQTRHNLDTLIAVHQLKVLARHRALGDAELLRQFWDCCMTQFGVSKMQEAIDHLLPQQSLPPNIDEAMIKDLPDTPGVYLFYADNRRLLYIGKSNSIRGRVLSHFSSALRIRKEMKLAMQVKDIDWIETAGEVGALLLESKLIKEKLPSMNIRLRKSTDLCAWQLLLNHDGILVPKLVRHQDLSPGRQENLYGLFYGRSEAIKTLQVLAKKHTLCEGLLGLEKLLPQKSCFGYQVKQCLGICVGQESILSYHDRLLHALYKYRVGIWPYKTAIGIREAHVVHVIDHWCYLGTAIDESEIFELLNSGIPEFDLDIYKIVKKSLGKMGPGKIIPLPKPAQTTEFESY